MAKNNKTKTNTSTANINPKIYYNNEYVAISDMAESDLVQFLDDRYSIMESANIRVEQAKERDKSDKQWTAISMYDDFGNLKINIPLEKNLEDVYEGRNSGKLNFDIQPDGKQASVDELQPASYAMEYYLE